MQETIEIMPVERTLLIAKNTLEEGIYWVSSKPTIFPGTQYDIMLPNVMCLNHHELRMKPATMPLVEQLSPCPDLQMF